MFQIHAHIRASALAICLITVPTSLTLGQTVSAQTAETQSRLTPVDALSILKAGNERFVSGSMLNRDLLDQVSSTEDGQYPFAVVLGCIDSRVPPELIFDQGIGDIFTARVAGNFVNTDILGSMEFATAVAGSKLIVVLGHTSCGAVKGACDQVTLGNLTHTLSNLSPAIYAVTEVDGPRNSSNESYVNEVAHANVELTVQNILDRSPVIQDLVAAGNLLVVGAMHDVSTGRVTFVE